MNNFNKIVGCMGLTLSGLAAGAGAQTFNFTINSTTSSYKEASTGSLSVSGNIIGNYSATNLTGTRTKPGLKGTWGATENDAIPLTGIATASSNATTPVSGSFVLVVDTTHSTVKVEKYSTTFFGTTPGGIVLGLSPVVATFQTQNPTFVYPSLSTTLPLGPLEVKNLKVVQGSAAGAGILKKVGTNVYTFAALFSSVVSSTVSVGTHTTVVTKPTIFGLTGTLTITGKTASFTESLTTSNQPSLVGLPAVLPTFPFALPTFTTQKANLLANLSIKSGSLKANSTLIIKAAGK